MFLLVLNIGEVYAMFMNIEPTALFQIASHLWLDKCLLKWPWPLLWSSPLQLSHLLSWPPALLPSSCPPLVHPTCWSWREFSKMPFRSSSSIEGSTSLPYNPTPHLGLGLNYLSRLFSSRLFLSFCALLTEVVIGSWVLTLCLCHCQSFPQFFLFTLYYSRATSFRMPPLTTSN